MNLCIFTHTVRTETLPVALKSYKHVFGNPSEIQIYKDGVNSTGLADGYIKAIQSNTDDYLFMLEHDWEFIRKPDHSLQEICEMMKRDGITHLRFNKRENIIKKKYDTWLTDKGWYCETPFVSNNPHIIDRKAYLEYIKNGWIQRSKGSKGIEEIISKHINGAVYGRLGHPQMVRHLNGR